MLETPAGELITCGGKYLGEATNNIAEYEALVWGLEVAAAHDIDELTVFSDSELLVRQMNGVYRVKHAGLKPLYARAVALTRRFLKVRIEHVRREQNKDADRLANEAMDTRSTVGTACDTPASPAQDSLF